MGDRDVARGAGLEAMKIAEAIAALQRLQQKWGDDVPVFFDCPECLKSFTPSHVAEIAVHVKSDPPPDKV